MSGRTRHVLEYDQAGGVKSLGRRRLLRLLQTETATALAERCGCSRSEISRLAAGKVKDPRYGLRKALAVAGIDLDAWDQPDVRASMHAGSSYE